MTKTVFSENFIVIDAEKSVKDTFEIIEELSPQYVIVSRTAGEEHFHYVFLAKLLESYLNHRKAQIDQNSERLVDFLYLHEFDGDDSKTISIQDPKNDPQLKELCSKPSSGGFEVLTDKNQRIIGIMDSIKHNKTAEYIIKGPGYTDKLIQNEFEYQEEFDSISDKENFVPLEPKSNSIPKRRSFRSKGISKPSEHTRRKRTQETKEITKYPTASLDENIPINKNSKMKIILKHSKPSTGNVGKIEGIKVDKDQTVTKFTVMVMSDPPNSIEFIGGNYKEIEVPTGEEDSAPIEFTLKPQKKGWHTIKAQFYFQGNYAGNVSVKTKVVDKVTESKPSLSSSSLDVNLNHKGPDLSIHILEMNSTPQKLEYMIMVISEKLGYPQKVFKKYR